MSDQALIAERDDWKRRAEANHAACEVMKRQLEECAAAKATVERALAKLEQRYLELEDQHRFARAELARLRQEAMHD